MLSGKIIGVFSILEKILPPLSFGCENSKKGRRKTNKEKKATTENENCTQAKAAMEEDYKCQICVVIFHRYLYKDVYRYLWQYLTCSFADVIFCQILY